MTKKNRKEKITQKLYESSQKILQNIFVAQINQFFLLPIIENRTFLNIEEEDVKKMKEYISEKNENGYIMFCYILNRLLESNKKIRHILSFVLNDPSEREYNYLLNQEEADLETMGLLKQGTKEVFKTLLNFLPKEKSFVVELFKYNLKFLNRGWSGYDNSKIVEAVLSTSKQLHNKLDESNLQFFSQEIEKAKERKQAEIQSFVQLCLQFKNKDCENVDFSSQAEFLNMLNLINNPLNIREIARRIVPLSGFLDFNTSAEDAKKREKYNVVQLQKNRREEISNAMKKVHNTVFLEQNAKKIFEEGPKAIDSIKQKLFSAKQKTVLLSLLQNDSLREEIFKNKKFPEPTSPEDVFLEIYNILLHYSEQHVKYFIFLFLTLIFSDSELSPDYTQYNRAEFMNLLNNFSYEQIITVAKNLTKNNAIIPRSVYTEIKYFYFSILLEDAIRKEGGVFSYFKNSVKKKIEQNMNNEQSELRTIISSALRDIDLKTILEKTETILSGGESYSGQLVGVRSFAYTITYNKNYLNIQQIYQYTQNAPIAFVDPSKYVAIKNYLLSVDTSTALFVLHVFYGFYSFLKEDPFYELSNLSQKRPLQDCIKENTISQEDQKKFFDTTLQLAKLLFSNLASKIKEKIEESIFGPIWKESAPLRREAEIFYKLTYFDFSHSEFFKEEHNKIRQAVIQSAKAGLSSGNSINASWINWFTSQCLGYRDKEFENIVAQNPYSAVQYAHEVLKNFFVEAEDVIFSEPAATLQYAIGFTAIQETKHSEKLGTILLGLLNEEQRLDKNDQTTLYGTIQVYIESLYAHNKSKIYPVSAQLYLALKKKNRMLSNSFVTNAYEQYIAKLHSGDTQTVTPGNNPARTDSVQSQDLMESVRKSINYRLSILKNKKDQTVKQSVYESKKIINKLLSTRILNIILDIKKQYQNIYQKEAEGEYDGLTLQEVFTEEFINNNDTITLLGTIYFYSQSINELSWFVSQDEEFAEKMKNILGQFRGEKSFVIIMLNQIYNGNKARGFVKETNETAKDVYDIMEQNENRKKVELLSLKEIVKEAGYSFSVMNEDVLDIYPGTWLYNIVEKNRQFFSHDDVYGEQTAAENISRRIFKGSIFLSPIPELGRLGKGVWFFDIEQVLSQIIRLAPNKKDKIIKTAKGIITLYLKENMEKKHLINIYELFLSSGFNLLEDPEYREYCVEFLRELCDYKSDSSGEREKQAFLMMTEAFRKKIPLAPFPGKEHLDEFIQVVAQDGSLALRVAVERGERFRIAEPYIFNYISNVFYNNMEEKHEYYADYENFKKYISLTNMLQEQESLELLKNVFSQNPNVALFFSTRLLKAPFVEGENVIASDPYCAYHYVSYFPARIENKKLLDSIYSSEHRKQQFLSFAKSEGIQVPDLQQQDEETGVIKENLSNRKKSIIIKNKHALRGKILSILKEGKAQDSLIFANIKRNIIPDLLLIIKNNLRLSEQDIKEIKEEMLKTTDVVNLAMLIAFWIDKKNSIMQEVKDNEALRDNIKKVFSALNKKESFVSMYFELLFDDETTKTAQEIEDMAKLVEKNISEVQSQEEKNSLIKFEPYALYRVIAITYKRLWDEYITNNKTIHFVDISPDSTIYRIFENKQKTNEHPFVFISLLIRRMYAEKTLFFTITAGNPIQEDSTLENVLQPLYSLFPDQEKRIVDSAVGLTKLEFREHEIEYLLPNFYLECKFRILQDPRFKEENQFFLSEISSKYPQICIDLLTGDLKNEFSLGSNNNEILENFIEKIAQNPEIALDVAIKRKERFKRAENAIFKYILYVFDEKNQNHNKEKVEIIEKFFNYLISNNLLYDKNVQLVFSQTAELAFLYSVKTASPFYRGEEAISKSVKYSLLYALEFPNRIENTNIANAILSDPNATKEFSKRAEVAAPFIPKDLGRNYTNKTIDERK